MSAPEAPAVPALARAVERASGSRPESVAAALVEETAGRGGGDGDAGGLAHAIEAIALLEAALRAHDDVLERDPDASAGRGDPVESGLAGAWLLGRASEVASGCGDEAAILWAEGTNRIVRALMLQLEDRYDAGRAASRHLEIARMRTGSLLSLAARLGSLASGNDDHGAQLDEFGCRLGTAVEIRAELQGLDDAGGAAAARRLAAGSHPLALCLALETDPELASSLGAPLDAEALGSVIDRVRAAGGIERAEDECRRQAAEAGAALAGMDDADGLRRIAAGVGGGPGGA